MNKKIAILCFVFFIICILLKTNVFASTLNIGINADKQNYNIGEQIKIRVSWSEGMQAAGFTLNYDSTKVEFCSASISSTFYNSDTKGKISVNWASLEEIDYTYIDFIFKANEAGNPNITVSNPTAFANSNLETYKDYNILKEGKTNILINGKEDNIDDKIDNNKADNKEKIVINYNEEEKPKTDKTVSENKHPDTGLKTSTFALMVIVFTIAIISYKQYKKLYYI